MHAHMHVRVYTHAQAQGAEALRHTTPLHTHGDFGSLRRFLVMSSNGACIRTHNAYINVESGYDWRNRYHSRSSARARAPPYECPVKTTCALSRPCI